MDVTINRRFNRTINATLLHLNIISILLKKSMEQKTLSVV